MKYLATILLVFTSSVAFAFDFTKNGKPAATIVVPDSATQVESYAAQMLARILKQGSGAEFAIAKESEKSPGPLIAVGHTKLAADDGVVADKLFSDGYRLRVKDNVLYIVGHDDLMPGQHVTRADGSLASGADGPMGTIRGAMRALELLGVRWVQPTSVGLHIPNLAGAKLPDTLDITYEPSIGYSTGGFAGWDEWALANGFRNGLRCYPALDHTWDIFVPASLWDKHPEYFRMKEDGMREKPLPENWMLCPTNPDVRKLLADGLRKKFDEGWDIVSLGQSDSWYPCYCPNCKPLGDEQVLYSHYLVAQDVYKTHPNKKVMLLAYDVSDFATSKAAIYPPNVMAQVCFTGALVGKFSGRDKALEYWAKRAPAGLTVYTYFLYAAQSVGIGPHFSPCQAVDHIKLLQRFKAFGIYECNGTVGGNWGAEGPTYYALGRAMNDPNADHEKLLDEYCDLTFGKAATTMKEYYRVLYSRVDFRWQGLAVGNGLYKDASYVAMFTPETQEQLGGLLTKAKTEADGDAHATNWLRTVEYSQRHFSSIARVWQLYHVFQLRPTKENLAQLEQEVKAWNAFCEEAGNLGTKEPAYVKDYFPHHGLWKNLKSYRSNNDGPFVLDFEKKRKELGL